jgi:hypothetical protein
MVTPSAELRCGLLSAVQTKNQPVGASSASCLTAKASSQEGTRASGRIQSSRWNRQIGADPNLRMHEVANQERRAVDHGCASIDGK